MVNNSIKSKYIIVKNNKIEKLFSNCILGLRRTLESKSKYRENSNGIRTHSHLVRKRTLNQLAKLASLAKSLSVRLRNKWLWVRILLPSLKLQIWRLLRGRCLLTFRQTIECRFTLKLVHDLIITCSHMENIPVLLFSTKMYLLTNLLVIVYYTIYYCLTMI